MTVDDANSDIEELLACRRSEKYSDVVEMYKKLSRLDQDNKFVLMAYGDSSYEQGDDLGALRAYLTLATKYPKSRGRNFALFGAAIALKNLQMQLEAKNILAFVDKSHPGLEEEVMQSVEMLSKQAMAKEILCEFESNLKNARKAQR